MVDGLGSCAGVGRDGELVARVFRRTRLQVPAFVCLMKALACSSQVDSRAAKQSTQMICPLVSSWAHRISYKTKESFR